MYAYKNDIDIAIAFLPQIFSFFPMTRLKEHTVEQIYNYHAFSFFIDADYKRKIILCGQLRCSWLQIYTYKRKQRAFQTRKKKKKKNTLP